MSCAKVVSAAESMARRDASYGDYFTVTLVAVPLPMHKMKNSVIYLRDLKND
jgi:hypothetical protein